MTLVNSGTRLLVVPTTADPIQLVARTAKEMGIEVRRGTEVFLEGSWKRVDEVVGLGSYLHNKAVDAGWAKLAANRSHLKGLEPGRDVKWPLPPWVGRTGKKRTLWDCIQSDGRFTPWRAHQRMGAPPVCPLCQHQVGDFFALDLGL